MNSDFNPDYPIKVPCQLRILHNAFFGPGEKKDNWIYKKEPTSNICLFPAEITENMVLYLAGLLTPLFGWKTLKIQEAFPDATYQDLDTGDIIKVEFERRTQDFIAHEHPVSGCDMIICWEDNLNQKEKAEYLFTKNPNLKIIELKKIFFHYNFELSV